MTKEGWYAIKIKQKCEKLTHIKRIKIIEVQIRKKNE